MATTTTAPPSVDAVRALRSSSHGARSVPVRRRKRIAAAILLLGASALGAVLVYGNVGDRQPVLAVGRLVERGEVIGSADLVTARVAADGAVRTIPVSRRSSIIGRRASVSLLRGSLLTRGAVADGPAVPDGAAVVGASLGTGQYPDGLAPGDDVLVVAEPDPAVQGTGGLGPASIKGLVVSVDRGRDGALRVSLAVPGADAAALAVAGSQGRIAVALAPR